jgi:hypothetical protein
LKGRNIKKKKKIKIENDDAKGGEAIFNPRSGY